MSYDQMVLKRKDLEQASYSVIIFVSAIFAFRSMVFLYNSSFKKNVIIFVGDF